MVVGPQTYHRLPELVGWADPASGALWLTQISLLRKFDFLPEEAAPRGPAAFLSVQEGCDKFCSFCVVPYTRGAELLGLPSRLWLARRLVETGTKEITLLGQNERLA